MVNGCFMVAVVIVVVKMVLQQMAQLIVSLIN
jgi:hypothetical protein